MVILQKIERKAQALFLFAKFTRAYMKGVGLMMTKTADSDKVTIEMGRQWRANVDLILKLLNWTRQDLAKAIGCAPTTMRFMLSGKREEQIRVAYHWYAAVMYVLNCGIEVTAYDNPRRDLAMKLWDELDDLFIKARGLGC